MALAIGIVIVGAAVVAFATLAQKAYPDALGGIGGGGTTTGGGSAPASRGGTTSAAGVSAGAASIMHYLMANGFTRTAAAGVVGNLQQESSLNPNAPGGGLAQWQAPRGPTSWSLAAQLQYLVHDMHTNYSGLLGQMNAAGSPAAAAVMFQNTYERPTPGPTENQAGREAYAQAAYKLG